MYQTGSAHHDPAVPAAGHRRDARRRWAMVGVLVVVIVASTLAGAARTDSAFSGLTQSSGNSFSAWTAPLVCNAYGMSVGPAAGLDHFWRLGESSGTTAVDSKGSANGTYIGDPALRVTPHSPATDSDTAARFDADISSVTVGDVNDFTGTASFTLEGWIRPSSGPGASEALIDKGGFTGDGWSLARDSAGRVRLRRMAGGVLNQATGTSVLAANTWSHVAGTYDGANLRVYVNGTLEGTTASSLSLANTTTSLRLADGQGTTGFTGKLDDIAVYTTALDAKTLQGHAQIDCSYSKLVQGTAGLLSYWPLDEATGATTATDTYSARNGTYSGNFTLGQPGALPNSPSRKAVQFGNTAQASVPDTSALHLDGAFTIEFWVRKPASVTVNYAGLIGRGVGNHTGEGYIVYYHTGNDQVSFKRDDFDSSKTLGGALADGNFHHIAFSYDGTTMRTYRDGVLVDTDTYSLAAGITTDPLLIGRGSSTNDGLTLDEVAVYNRGLADTEIATHYNAR